MTTATPSRHSRSYQLGKYQVRAHIASGGMGAVYRAVDTETGRNVALKVLPPEYAARPAVVERFRREFITGSKLRHENIAALYEFAEVADTYFLVMEFVDGINLYQHIRARERLGAEETRDILIQVAGGLDHAHRQGIIHRDIKPSNILLTRVNGRTIAKLIDLGLARETREDEFRLTRDGTTVGTVDYLAPEQARDSRSADVRSDIYSLGCTLYHMLAGVPPFAEGSLTERIFQHAEADPPDPSRLNPAIPADLLAICRRMLAKKPAERYQTPAELLHDLTGAVVSSGRPASEPSVPHAEPLSTKDTVLLLQGAETPHSLIVGEDPSPATLERRRVASGQFQRATQVLAGANYEYGLELLLAACRLDPTNLLYRHALRQTHQAPRRRRDNGRWRDWLAGVRLFLRFQLAKRRRKYEQVIHLGEEFLSREPKNLGIQLDMAQAAESAGFVNLAVWLLEQAKIKEGTHVRAKRALARLFEKQHDLTRALGLWKLICKVDPADGEAVGKIRELAKRLL